MGMRLKPEKCRSFSIRSGVPNIINFFIGETEIPNLFQEEQKFLGNLLFPIGKLSDTFDYIESEFEKKLFLRSRYLLSPYRDYINCTKLFTWIN